MENNSGDREPLSHKRGARLIFRMCYKINVIQYDCVVLNSLKFSFLDEVLLFHC